ncbi:MAG TPA: fumarate hydratase, partial [Nitrospirae bacterium]|nr:fumarate hydratase [Nitrospirota bacterium]
MKLSNDKNHQITLNPSKGDTRAPEFKPQDLFPLSEDKTKYRLITNEYISIEKFNGNDILVIKPEALIYLANEATKEASFFLRSEHLQQIADILKDPEASNNDKFVAKTLLFNAQIASKGKLPLCQDTGTAIIIAKKGQQVWTGVKDENYLSAGVYKTFTEQNLRYSQMVPLTMYEEINSKCNLPAQIEIYANDGMEYKFLFITKGGGSANKSYLFQETKAVLNPESLERFLVEKMKTLGTSACPPYHLVFVIGGTSAETCLKTVKIATTKYLDNLPISGNEMGQAFRDIELEQRLLQSAYKIGYGAQFGGKYFVLDVRVIRLPRHGASCPIGMGVSCVADRNVKAKINKEGLWIEELEHDPAKFISDEMRLSSDTEAIKIDLNRPIKEVLNELSRYPLSTRLLLTGKIVVARDIAHAKFKERIDNGEVVPEYLLKYPVYYAGPAKKPTDQPSGSFGPTTAGRMDSYVELLQSKGASLIMIAKG